MSIKGQGHSLTLVKGHSDFKVKTCFFTETVGRFGTKAHMKANVRMGMKMLKLGFLKNSLAIWNQNSYESLRENRNENLYK